jgi:hypothetical protein
MEFEDFFRQGENLKQDGDFFASLNESTVSHEVPGSFITTIRSPSYGNEFTDVYDKIRLFPVLAVCPSTNPYICLLSEQEVVNLLRFKEVRLGYFTLSDSYQRSYHPSNSKPLDTLDIAQNNFISMKLELPPVLKLDFRFESPRIITNLQTLF